jgi:mRNA interferase MazF
VKRGEIFTVATGGGFGGKPRPMLLIQADSYAALTTLVFLPFTSVLADRPSPLRPRFEPDAVNGLRDVSELMIHAPITARQDDLGQFVGQLQDEDLVNIERALASLFGLRR